jgi:hypothetical protein
MPRPSARTSSARRRSGATCGSPRAAARPAGNVPRDMSSGFMAWRTPRTRTITAPRRRPVPARSGGDGGEERLGEDSEQGGPVRPAVSRRSWSMKRAASPPRASASASTSEAAMRTAASMRASGSMSRSTAAPAIQASVRSAGTPRAEARRRSGAEELGRAEPLAQALARDGHAVDEQAAEERVAADELAADGGVHDLDEAGGVRPDDHEVGQAAGRAHDRDRGQGLGLAQEQVVGGDEVLLGVEAEGDGDLLEGVDRGAVDLGLAGLAQAAVADGDAVAVEQALERGGAAVHGGALDHLDGEAAAARHGHGARICPTVRRRSEAGETDSTVTSTTPTRPCSTGSSRPGGGELALDAHEAVLGLAGDRPDGADEAAELGPREAVEAQADRLAGRMRPTEAGVKRATTRRRSSGMTTATTVPRVSTPPGCSGTTPPRVPAIGARRVCWRSCGRARRCWRRGSRARAAARPPGGRCGRARRAGWRAARTARPSGARDLDPADRGDRGGAALLGLQHLGGLARLDAELAQVGAALGEAARVGGGDLGLLRRGGGLALAGACRRRRTRRSPRRGRRARRRGPSARRRRPRAGPRSRRGRARPRGCRGPASARRRRRGGRARGWPKGHVRRGWGRPARRSRRPRCGPRRWSRSRATRPSASHSDHAASSAAANSRPATLQRERSAPRARSDREKAIGMGSWVPQRAVGVKRMGAGATKDARESAVMRRGERGGDGVAA